MHRYRTHHCGQLRETNVGERVRLSGWVHRIRDHGGLLFVDLRDHFGLTQCVVKPDSLAFAAVEALRAEWVVRIDGELKARTGDTVNRSLPTGHVEVFVSEVDILSQADDLPLPVFGEPDSPEDLRLRYRFLALRRERLHGNIVKRNTIISCLRKRMEQQGFSEFQTPILTASSPEGARDFLVPSRLHPGAFYALPQAPQQFKQLIMVSGFDRYFQIAPCFRDEDPRADRFPGEFYQLDVEMSFVTQEDVLTIIEPVIRGLFEDFADGKTVEPTLPRIPYREAVRKYGSDKPDLRNPIVMSNVTEQFSGSGFKLFADMIARDRESEIWAIPARGGGSRAFCDRMNGWAQGEGQPGLGYMILRDGEGAGPIAKNIGPGRSQAIRAQLALEDGDSVFFVAGKPKIFADFAGKARQKIGFELGLVEENRFVLAWIVDFPMYEFNEDDQKIEFSHNPFSMPQGGLEALDNADPLDVLAFQYDLVCNGYEIASGAIRNHDPKIMKRAFALAGYDEQVLEERFSALYRAFHYGAPPHGGIAAGLDRIIMLLCNEKNLREIALFPMNQRAQDVLMGAPSVASASQLRALSLRPFGAKL